MSLKKGIVFLTLLSLVINIQAQFSRFNADVYGSDGKLEFGLVGGMISPQFSEVDLNNDGTLDLFIFDKAGNVPLTFINEGSPNEVDYRYAPSYERFFPAGLKDWVMLRDYNGDDIKDIFAYSDVPGIDGVIVYTGKYVNNVIQFDRNDFTHYTNNNVIPVPAGNDFTNLYVTSQDYPGIDDIDGDGDLDIVTFAVGGGHVYLFENQSVELGYGLDSLIFLLEDDCWGRFYESGITEAIDLSDDINICENGFQDENDDTNAATIRHAGSTVLTLDMDADGDKDLILGDISFSNLNQLTNGGDTETAFMTDQDAFFPSYNVSADIQIFPSSYYVDVNNDGIKDLLVSPNVWKPGENHEVVWQYENIGENDEPVFQFVEKEFLVGDMIDMGKEAHPTFVDYNADGLLDIVVGNNTFYQPFGERKSRLYLYENTGSATDPEFTLVDEDYLGFSVFDDTGNTSPAPTFGDLDNDGDLDVLIGETSGGFYFGENIAGQGNPIEIEFLQFGYMGLDVGAHAIPQIVDLNRDGKMDIVTGEKVGRLVYFQNEGTPEEPMFVPNISSNEPAGNNIIALGLVDTKLGLASGYAAPFFYDFGAEYGLFAGSERGNVLKYSNIDNNIDGIFNLDTDFFGEVRPGFFSIPVLVDINNDEVLEMFTGNVRGGLTAYKTNLMTDGSFVSTNPVLSTPKVSIFPNPAQSYFNIEIEGAFNASAEIKVFNAIGQQVSYLLSNDQRTAVATENWGKGLFVVQVKIGSEVTIKKVIVQ